VRRVRYNVAASLDAYIADAEGGFDWIPHDPSVDFGALFANVDTVLLGRRSYDLVQAGGPPPWSAGARVFVFSRTLRQQEHPAVTIVPEHAADVVAALRAESGTGDIWLFGGGTLFATLLAAGQVDAVEVTVVPVLLGAGVPLLPRVIDGRVVTASLTLEGTHAYPSGMLALHYGVRPGSEPRA
jgi:dihydrofolate reductase